MITSALGNTAVSVLDIRQACPVAYNWSGSAYVGNNLCAGSGSNIIAAPQAQIGGFVLPGTQNTIGGSSVTSPSTLFDFVTPILMGSIVTDQLATGANTGVPNAFANANCQPLDCLLYRPPTSPDTTGPGVAITSSKPSYYMLDYSQGQHNEIYANPGLQPNSAGGISNVGNYSSAFFTQTSQGNTQGNPQVRDLQLNVWAAPGQENDALGCPTSCPQSPFTALSQWSTPGYQNITNTFNGQGIRVGRGYNYIFGHSAETTFEVTEGGIKVPSDEGGYRENSHMYNAPDFQETITSIIDNYHLKGTPFTGNGTQGTGRYLLDNTRPVNAPDTIGTVNPPGTNYPVGTVVFNNASFPVSYVYGTIVGTCAVPVQEGTVASTTCTVAITGGSQGAVDISGSGAHDGVGLFCAAQNNEGNIIFGGQVTAVGAVSGGQQTITVTIPESVQSNPSASPIPIVGYFFQGGTCGDVIELLADNQNYQGDSGAGAFSVFPSIGSYTNHVLTYFQPGGSQIWQSIPQKGSFFKTTNTSGENFGAMALTNVVRNSGLVTANFFSQGSNQDFFNGQTSGLTISNCSDPTLNGTVPATPGYPSPGVISWNDSRANTTCSSGALITATAAAYAYVFPAAEVLDIRDPTNGFQVDGYITHTYQPAFQTGDNLQSPVYSSSTFSITHDLLELSSPCEYQNISCNGYAIVMQNDSAYHGAGLYLENDSQNYRSSGQGGFAYPADLIHAVGAWNNGIIMDIAPGHYKYALEIGQPAFNLAAPLQNFFLLGVEAGGANESDLAYDYSGQVYGAAHSFNFRNNQAAFGNRQAGPVDTMLQIAPTSIESYVPHSFAAEAIFTNDVVTTQFHDMLALGNGGGLGLNAQWDFDNYLSPAVLGTQGTAGSSVGIYLIGVNYTFGVSFTPAAFIYTAPATLNGTNYVTVSCSAISANSLGTGTVYNATSNGLLKTVGACANSSATVNDQGTYGTVHQNGALSVGAPFYSGGFIANGASGKYCWTQANIFNDSSNPIAPDFCISQSAGAFSFDTNASGNGQGTIAALSGTLNGSPICTTANGACASGGVSGQTAGYAIEAATATTATGPFPMDDSVTTANTVTIHKNVVIVGSGASTGQLGTNTFSSLNTAYPCASGQEGTWAPVTDSTTATYGATITGGGTNHVLAYCNGSTWAVH